MPLVIDNSATAIICNSRKGFTGPLTPTKITLETAEGTSVSTTLVGTLRPVLLPTTEIDTTLIISETVSLIQNPQ